MELCSRDITRFFDYWLWTWDPRLVGSVEAHDGWLPLDLFPRQREMVDFFAARVAAKEDGLVEKSRDIGFTWVAGGFALHKWLFTPGFKSAFGSRTEDLVDKLGDPDSIFEKIRMMLKGMPRWMRPPGFMFAQHALRLRIVNPENGNVIRGEGGENMGRGGRSTLYVIDEAAYLENGEMVDRATAGNSDVRIFGSSVNQPGDMFARKRFSGQLRADQIFRFHYTDDPRKTPEWAAKKKASMEPSAWAAEYDIDYSAAVEGICIPAKWVNAATEIAELLEWANILPKPARRGIVGADVGGGKAKSVAIARFGPWVMPPASWRDGDTTETAYRILDYAKDQSMEIRDVGVATIQQINYDPIGVGSGVQSTMRHAPSKEGMITEGVNVGNPPTDRVWPDGQDSASKFFNLKAELWFMARHRFKATYEMWLWLNDRKQEGAVKHPPDELIILPSQSTSPDVMTLCGQLSLVKWTRNEKGKVIMESKASLQSRGLPSPDHAEAFVLSFFEGKYTNYMDNIG